MDLLFQPIFVLESYIVKHQGKTFSRNRSVCLKARCKNDVGAQVGCASGSCASIGRLRLLQ